MQWPLHVWRMRDDGDVIPDDRASFDAITAEYMRPYVDDDYDELVVIEDADDMDDADDA